MNKGIKQVIRFFIPILFILGIDALFPITFGLYFVICALALIASYKGKAHSTGWAMIVTASVIVTLNYLRPHYDEYNNTAHHIITLNGFSSDHELYLVDSDNPKKALFDEQAFEGKITINSNDDGNCRLNFLMRSQPLYVYDKGVYKLANKEQMPSFCKSIMFARDSDSLLCNFISYGNSLTIRMTSYLDGIQKNDTSSFTQVIKKGYPLVDIIQQGFHRDSNKIETEYAILLEGTSIVRDSVENNSSHTPIWYVSVPKKVLQQFRIYVDKNLYQPKEEMASMILSPSNKMYLGFGSNETRAVCFTSHDGKIVMKYDMPIMYNFPTDTIVGASRLLAISTSSEALLFSDVKETFYYDLFKKQDNDYNFNGQLSYQSSYASTPLRLAIVDGRNDGEGHETSFGDVQGFELSSKNNVKWQFKVIDMRKDSPISGNTNIWINEWFILAFILVLSLLAILIYNIFLRLGSSRAEGVFHVWLFFIPLLTLRLYLLWRIAVFPPLINISKNEFLRYRMENSLGGNAMIWTIICVVLLVIFSFFIYWCSKKMGNKTFNFSNRKARWLFIVITVFCIGIVLSNKILHLGWVFGNVALPVIVFFVNEYLCLRKLSLGYRIINAILVLGMLVLGDPGYAIMFLIFECLYYIILSVIYRWSFKGVPFAKWQTAIVSFMIIILAISAPWIVVQLYDGSSILGGIINRSHLNSFILGTVISLILWYIIKGTLNLNTKKGRAIKICIILLPFVISIFAPKALNNNLHFKYRSLIHTQNAGQIMCKLSDEDIQRDNSRRLLEASQNQWFLQYHNNLGEHRITERGLMHLYPHFKKGVSWSTQISDVICSRYIVGELSLVVPLAIIFFLLVFLLISFYCATSSSSGKVLSCGVALLLLVQTTFVWMANTNRTIFIGQDFPFMSQNARVTMILFIFLLLVAITFIGSRDDQEDLDGKGLQKGYAHFNGRPISLFISFFCIVFAIVFVTGNKWNKLYGNNNVGEFGLGDAMEQANIDFSKINELLAKYQAKIELTKNNCDKVFTDIDEKIHLSKSVQELCSEHKISDFSYSLYQAFKEKLVTCNSSENIVHLRHIKSQNAYRFALNNSFYSLRAPEMKEKLWKGNIYAYESPSEIDAQRIQYQGKDNVVVYRIPKTWLPKGASECGIVDLQRKETDSVLICDMNSRIKVRSYTFLLNQDDALQCYVNDGMYLHRLAGMQENLLAKNMMINGSSQFFYPLSEKFYWIKYFSDYEVAQNWDNTKRDCYLTLDKELIEKIASYKLNYSFSVVALDGNGNVRLMMDNNRHPNPNDYDEMEDILEKSYLNPDYESDSKLFGNMNLVHMRPGPGSSLKPITYAAVTSQTKAIDWNSLKLHVPPSTWKNGNGEYSISKFGPSYNYDYNQFVSPSGDEIGDGKWVDNDFYLYKSSNYYNALITFLGNFYSNEYNNLASILSPAEETDDSYPIIQINGMTYKFSKSPGSKRDGWILSTALDKNFNLAIRRDDKDRTFGLIGKDWQNKPSKNILYPWLFPERSTAYMGEFEKLNNESLRLKQYTLGAYPLEITPLHMAEMYGCLYSLHPDYHACITVSPSIPSAEWNTCKEWEQDDIFSFYKSNIYKGLKNCANKGTASSTLEPVETQGKYFLYAKTGTLKRGERYDNDKMLAVIITNKEVCTDNSVQSSSDFRFFVVYFMYHEAGKMPSETAHIINDIINSKSFKDYMK